MGCAFKMEAEIRSLNFGLAPKHCRIIPGCAPPETRAGKKFIELFLWRGNR
jgi:hypothetical protein